MFSSVVLSVLVVLIQVIIGCGKPDRSASEPTPPSRLDSPLATGFVPRDVQQVRHDRSATSARRFLQDTLARYQHATSYHDDGQVRLSVIEDGKSVVRAAPMSIWLDRGEVDLVAYDVRITIEDSVLEAWLVDPASDNMDSQVLQAPLPLGHRRASLRLGLADPILAGRLAAGLAGPPPQLDWLLADDPMSGLFRGGHQFRFIADQQVENQWCRCVKVSVNENNQTSQFVFFVDQDQGVIRQIDLPEVTLTGQDDQPLRASIRIELRQASFQPPKRRSVRDGYPDMPKHVKHFVPVPLPPPSASAEVPPQLREDWTQQVRQYQSQLQTARR